MNFTNRYLGRRILARLIDISLVVLLVKIIDETNSNLNSSLAGLGFVLFFSYNLLFTLLSGVTIGRWACRIKFKSTKFLTLKLIWRELMFIVLIWAVAIEFIFSKSAFVHERFSHTELVLK